MMLTSISTFIGIAVHNATANMGKSAVMDFAAGVRQDASGLLGTTLLLADLVSVDTFALDWKIFYLQTGYRS
jgi:hypothetical protein